VGGKGTHRSAVDAARIEGEELSRDMYSVLRSQETCAATGRRAATTTAAAVVVIVAVVSSAKVGCAGCWVE
jgi:hypothetical protein